MEKFNRYWMLKYSEHREQLRRICLADKSVFLDSVVFEVTYPLSFEGPQIRYVPSLERTFLNDYSFPDGTIFKKLTRDEKSRLFSYYQLDKSICYGKKD